ncbi:hypothetical protein HYR69_07950 [Candidatus Sumerlaeota bacterium]|nr:hypothetical protein [Candidatus Sumerlaeota bacterium]
MKRILICLSIAALGIARLARAEDAPAAAPAPAQPSLDQLLQQLMTFKPEELKAKFDGLKGEAAKMQEDAKGLRAQADALEAKAADLLKRIQVLEELVKALPALPAAAPAKPEEKKAAEAKPEEMKAEEKKMAAAPAAPPAAEAKMEEKKDDKPKITYADNVAPILMAKCASCHNQDKAKSDLAIDTYERVMQGGGSGADIVAGDPQGSRLYRLITHQEEPKMPMGGSKLDDASLDIIKQWIEQGALKDKNAKKTVKAAASAATMAAAALPAVPAGQSPMPVKQEGAKPAPLHGPLAIKAVASSPGAPLVAVSGYRQILLYHAETLELLRTLDFPEGIAESIKFSPNGALLIAAGGEAGKIGLAAVYDVQTGDRVGEYGKTFDTVLTADISLDQTQVAVGGTNKKVKVFSTADGQMQYEITKHTDWVQAVAFSPDGWFLATGDRAGGLYVWQAETGRDVHTLRGHTGAVNTVDFRHDSQALASAGADGQIYLWEMNEGKNVKKWGAHGPGVLSIKFARDGRLVSSGADQVTILWNGDGGRVAAFPAVGDWAYSACFAAQDSRVLAGSWKGEVKVWEVAGTKELGTLKLMP